MGERTVSDIEDAERERPLVIVRDTKVVVERLQDMCVSAGSNQSATGKTGERGSKPADAGQNHGSGPCHGPHRT